MKIRITQTETGETADVHAPGETWEKEKWHWTEGNYGCDCNRVLLFYRHGKGREATEEEADVFCKDDEKYTIEVIDAEAT